MSVEFPASSGPAGPVRTGLRSPAILPFTLLLLGLLLTSPSLQAASLAESREAAHARTFLMESRADLVVSQCRQFRERFPASALADQVLDMEGQAWRLLKRPAEAHSAWQTLATSHAESPLAPRAMLSMGDCQQDLGRTAEAIKAWQRVAERFPASAEALEGLLRADAALAAPRPTLALDPAGDAEREKTRLDLLRRAMELDADSDGGLEACRRWAMLLLKQGRVSEARFLLQRVTREAAPGLLHQRALGELVALENQDQQREAALAALQVALDDYEDSPLRARLWLELARLRLELGLPEASERGLRLALDQVDAKLDAPAHVDSLRILHADALALSGRCAELTATEVPPTRHPHLLARHAACLAVQGDSSRAALLWAEVADSLSRRPPARQDPELLSFAVVELTRCQRATGLAALPWEEVAALAGRVPGSHPELTEVAEVLLQLGLAHELDPLLESRHDAPRWADRRAWLRLRQALALGRQDQARDFVRIFRQRWAASPLAVEVEALAPPDLRVRPGSQELDLLLAEWRQEPSPSPEDLRSRITRLEALRRDARGDETRVAAALVAAWHELRLSMERAGRDATAQKECARLCLAWGDSLREAEASTLFQLAASYDYLKQGENAARLWTRLVREQEESAEALDAARALVASARCDSTLRRELVSRFTTVWPWAPDAHNMLLHLARQERAAGNPQRSLDLCEALLSQWEVAPVAILNTPAVAALMESAWALQALQSPDEARRRWLHVASLAEQDSQLRAQALLAAAQSFLGSERMAEAQQLATRVTELGGDEARLANQLLASLERGEGRHGEALARLDKLKAGSSQDLGLRVQWVCALYRAGRADRGKPEFQRLMKDAPKGAVDTLKARVNVELGLASLAAGDLAQAEKSFSLVAGDLAHTPQAASAQVGLARVFKAQGKTDKALKALDQVDKHWPLTPSGAEAAALRAQMAEAAGDAAGAIKASWQEVERSRGLQRHRALSGLIELAARLNRPADEQQALVRYREDYPFAQDRLARRLREARLLIKAGEAAAARAQLRALQAEAVGEEAAELQYRLAEAAEAAGDLPGAVLEFEKTAHLDPAGGLDWGASALFEAARGWQGLGHKTEARRALQDVIRHEGADSAHGQRARLELEAIGLEEKP